MADILKIKGFSAFFIISNFFNASFTSQYIIILPIEVSDGSGSKIFDLGRISHLWFGLEFGKFSLKMSNFSIFFPLDQKKLLRVGPESTQVKAGLASYLLRVKSKLGSGQGPSLIEVALRLRVETILIFSDTHNYLLQWEFLFHKKQCLNDT